MYSKAVEITSFLKTRIKHTTLLEGETFLRNKHEIEFFEIKCIFFGRKENTISVLDWYFWIKCSVNVKEKITVNFSKN